jgi:aminopeptidase 2
MIHLNSAAASGARVARSDASRSLRRVLPSRPPSSTCIASKHLTSLRPSTGHSYLLHRQFSSTTSGPALFSPRTSPNHQLRYRNPTSSNKLSRTQIRACSYQRHNMCRHSLGADVVESAVDVTKGREVLPTNVKPLHYRLTLEPNLETFEYTGTVEIEYAVPYVQEIANTNLT